MVLGKNKQPGLFTDCNLHLMEPLLLQMFVDGYLLNFGQIQLGEGR